MITLKNKNALDKYTEKVNNFQIGDICYCYEENKCYIYKVNGWHLVSATEQEESSLSIYGLNKQILLQYPNIENWDEVAVLLKNYYKNNCGKYHMLMCKELSYFTLFVKNSDLNIMSYEESIIDYIKDVGKLKAINETSDKIGIELWIEIDSEIYCFILFDYSNGIILFS